MAPGTSGVVTRVEIAFTDTSADPPGLGGLANFLRTLRSPTILSFKSSEMLSHLVLALPLLVPFGSAVSQADKSSPPSAAEARKSKAEIREGILPEIPGILVWALHGSAAHMAHKKYPPLASSIRIVDTWKLDSDPVEGFIDSR